MRSEGLTTMDYMEQLSCSCFSSHRGDTENNLEIEAAYASLRQGSGQATGPIPSFCPEPCLEGEAEGLGTGNDRTYDCILAGDLFAPPPPVVAGEGEL